MFIQLLLFAATMYSRKRETMRQIGKLWERLLTPGRTNDPQSWRFQLYQSHTTDIATGLATLLKHFNHKSFFLYLLSIAISLNRRNDTTCSLIE